MNIDKKTIIQTLLLGILVLAIPLSIQLIQTQTQLKSKATGEGIVPVESDTLRCTGSGTSQRCTTARPEVELRLDSPFGASPSATQ